MKKNGFNIVGKEVIRQDGYAKVTGKALFADDIKIHDLHYAAQIRTKVAHAELMNIDYSAIEDDPNLIAVCDSRDIPAVNIVGLVKRDQPIFADKKIVTEGDVVAIVIAKSLQLAKELASRVKVNYKELPILSDPLQSLNESSPLIHPEAGTNLINQHSVTKGDVEKGLSESEHIIEQTYKTQLAEHAYIEPECVSAIPEDAGRKIKIIGSIQNPHSARRIVAEVLGWELNRVRIVQAELGGSFGGKDDSMIILAARSAVAALKIQKPVRIKLNREDSITESYKRHPYIMNYKVGFNSDGIIRAMRISIIADGGAYASMSPFVTWRTVVQATGPYEIENVSTDVKAVYTNNPYTGAFRGFGSPQPIFAQESIMDDIAEMLNMDPLEIRLKNGLKNGSITATGQKLKNHDVNLSKVLGEAEKSTGFVNHWLQNSKENWQVARAIKEKQSLYNSDFSTSKVIDRLDGSSNPIRKGIGLACSFRGCSLGAEGIDAAAGYISVQADGSVYILSGLAENGQGLKTTFSIIAAEVFGISPDNIVYLDQDTGFVADSGPTVASRSTLMGGAAIKDGSEKIKKRLENLIFKEFNLPDNTKLNFIKNKVVNGSDRKELLTFRELCHLAINRGVQLSEIGWYKAPKTDWDEEKGKGDAYFTYVYGCQVAEVTVNLLTGEILIDKITAVHDPGKVINKLGAEGQVYGGVTQGAGYGIFEEITTSVGLVRDKNFDQLIIPTSKDIGIINPIFIEGVDQSGPWGAKSLGEPTLELTAAAIANAVKNATGIRYFELPLNLEEIFVGSKLSPESLERGSV